MPLFQQAMIYCGNLHCLKEVLSGSKLLLCCYEANALTNLRFNYCPKPNYYILDNVIIIRRRQSECLSKIERQEIDI